MESDVRMKKIEQMSHEWWLKQRDLSIKGDPVTYAPDPTSWEEGFKACRELAATIEFNASGDSEEYYKIVKLGEEEV